MQIKKIPLNFNAFVVKIKEHKDIKEKLLKLINQSQYRIIKSPRESISKTDWDFSKQIERHYVVEFTTLLRPYINKMAEELGMNKTVLHNMWFQNYGKTDRHDRHIHEGTHWTNIYFLDLPNTKLKTEIYDPFTKKTINSIKLEEGDLFTIPAQTIHRSPKNTSAKQKTIISFNTTFSIQ